MAQFKLEPKVTFRIFMDLSEPEARALEALVGYGTEEFLRVFYEHMGQHYMKPHEDGLYSLFESVRKTVKPQLSKVDEVRKLFRE